jgi:2-octaprenyl-6-methoxyphenol hydroxylase
MTTPAHAHYDVVIIGAGMVGATLACALTQAPQPSAKILLIEATRLFETKPEQPGFDARSTVLSASSVDYLQQLGLWQSMYPHAAAIQHIQVSDQGHFGGVNMDAAEAGVAALGYVVENAAIGQALNQAVLQNSQLELCAPVTVTSITPVTIGMCLQLQAADADELPVSLTASLVVLADGGRSGLVEQLGIYSRKEGYGQSAIIANLAMSQPHRGMAYERFTAKGPLALLPLLARDGKQRMALVWTHPADDVADVLALAEADFIAKLQHDCGQRAGQILQVGKRIAYPLALQVAEEQIRPALVLLGNVAHTLHPVAGQGFNLALRDAMALAANIRTSWRDGVNPGSYGRLQQWWEAVQQDQARTITFSDVMTRVFSSHSTALSVLRKFGLVGLELLPALKQEFTQQALGYQAPRARL